MPDSGTSEAATESIPSEGTEGATFVPDPHTVQSDS
jgi:hypothetical protein